MKKWSAKIKKIVVHSLSVKVIAFLVCWGSLKQQNVKCEHSIATHTEYQN